MYMMHHNKRARRTKVRVRTYLTSGDLTFLEVKRKNNHGRTKKKRIQVPSLEQSQMAEGAQELVQRKTGMSFLSMHQVVQNLFDRVTLVNAMGMFIHQYALCFVTCISILQDSASVVLEWFGQILD